MFNDATTRYIIESLHDRIEALEREAAEINAWIFDDLPKYFEWEPIQTAPKDGTRIIVNDPKRSNKTYKTKVLVVFWHKENEEWVSTMSNAHNPVPTHWMHLPDPPTEEETK